MNHLKLVHLICKDHIQEGNVIIDATVGNGHDTLFLANLIKNHKKSKLYGYDIQKKAIDATKGNLKSQGLKYTSLKCASHEQIETDFSIQSVDLILFNLGYLPGSDKAITTTSKSTLAACQSSLKKLTANGLLIITVYPGHPQGKIEDEYLRRWIESMNSTSVKAYCYKLAKASSSPYVIIVKINPKTTDVRFK